MMPKETGAGMPLDNGKPVWRVVSGFLLISVIALGLRFANYSHEPITDEFYHVLAAASWLEDGTFSIADGSYSRGRLFTMMLASVTAASDGDLNALRAFCVVLGVLLVIAIYVGNALIASRREAWVAALMIGLMPGAIFLSQYIRFYSLHALVFWTASLCIYFAAQTPIARSRRLLLLASAGILLLISIHLQVTTVIGLAGILLGLLAINWPAIRSKYEEQSAVARKAIVTTAAALAIAVPLLLAGPLDFILDIYRSAALWSSGSHASYYLRFYGDQFGFIWALFPAAVIISLIARPRPALFCVCIYVTAFVFHSFAGMQAERFSFYTMPFFVTIWAIAGVYVVGQLHGLIERQLVSLGDGSFLGNRSGLVATALVSLSILFSVAFVPALEMTAKMTLGKTVRSTSRVPVYWSRYGTSWTDAAAELRDVTADADLLVTSQGLHAIYYLGDFDVEISRTRLSDFQGLTGDNLDPRTGRRVIGDVESLRQLVACHDSGVLIVHELGWRNARIVDDEVAEFAEATMQQVPTVPDWGLVVYRWQHDDVARAADCS